ncbi:SPOSA6832_03474, partial [Sporobolomyces salmonicolor]
RLLSTCPVTLFRCTFKCPTNPFRRRRYDDDYDERDETQVIKERVNRERPCRTLFVRNLKFGLSSEEVRAPFAAIGDIKTFFDLLEKRAMVFITYYDARAAMMAKDRLHNHPLAGRPMDVHYSLPRDADLAQDCDREKGQGTLSILIRSPSGGPLPPPTDQEIFNRFGPFGDIKAVFPSPQRPEMRYIEFFDSRGAAQAFDQLGGREMAGGVAELKFEWDQQVPTPAPAPPVAGTPAYGAPVPPPAGVAPGMPSYGQQQPAYPGAPVPGPYGAPPPSNVGYGAPPPSNAGYGAPPPSSVGYGAPPPPGNTGYGPPPPANTGYGAPPPPANTGYGGPPPPGNTGYGVPPPPGSTGFGQPASNVGYGPPPPSNIGYGPPPAGATPAGPEHGVEQAKKMQELLASLMSNSNILQGSLPGTAPAQAPPSAISTSTSNPNPNPSQGPGQGQYGYSPVHAPTDGRSPLPPAVQSPTQQGQHLPQAVSRLLAQASHPSHAGAGYPLQPPPSQSQTQGQEQGGPAAGVGAGAGQQSGGSTPNSAPAQVQALLALLAQQKAQQQ